ncbi:MAG TPA: hypothetical protein VFU40_13560 [Gemmatimonadales bacterium]|nr:hypothetical protein [Gemmatimonadales bacterium]
MTKRSFVPLAVLLGVVLTVAPAVADEAPISGTVKAIDHAAKTLTIQTVTKGKTRDVTVHLRPESRIVKFARPTEPGKTGFVEQPLALSDLKPGWIVSVIAKHEGSNEVAEIVKVVLEK